MGQFRTFLRGLRNAEKNGSKKGEPFRHRRWVKTEVIHGKGYVTFLRARKGFHTERVPLPGSKAGVVWPR